MTSLILHCLLRHARVENFTYRVSAHAMLDGIASYLGKVARSVKSASDRTKRVVDIKAWIWDTGAALDIVPKQAMKK